VLFEEPAEDILISSAGFLSEDKTINNKKSV
jgi:hypothetical protein